MKTLSDDVYKKLVICAWASRDTIKSALLSGAIRPDWVWLFTELHKDCEEALDWLDVYENKHWYPTCKDLGEPEEDVFI